MKYNVGLVIAGISAFILYITILEIKSGMDTQNMDPEKYEFTLFTTLFQGIGYLIMMGIANLFYFLGPFSDKIFNRKNSESFRNKLYTAGFWFSCLLPFSVPVLVLIFV